MGVICKKQYITIAGIILLISGLSLVGLSIITSEVNKDDNDQSPVYKFNNVLFYVIISTGGIFLLIGLLGICGSKRKNVSCIRCFQTLNCICLLFVALILIAVCILKFAIMDDLKDEEKCKSNFFVKPINQYNDIAVQVLGTTKCPVQNYNLEKTLFYTNRQLVFVNSNSDGARSVFDCLDFEIESRQAISGNYSIILKQFEFYNNCGGMCTYQDYYLFSNILRGAPSSQNSCAEQIVEKIDSKALAYVIIVASIFVFLFLNVAIAYQLQKNKKPSTYLDDSDVKNPQQQKYQIN